MKTGLKTGLIAALTVATATSVGSADIVYSGVLNQTADAATGPGTIDIMGQQWGFGHESGGPLDYSFVSANNSGSGVFVELGTLLRARNFASGDTIGTFTEVLNMFPTAGGSENANITLYDYAAGDGGEGNFPSTGTGFVGFGFGGGVNFNYGWMRFTLEGLTRRVTLVDWAYESVVNQSIEVGAVPAPGVLAVMAVAGLAGRRRRA
jgi:MYXO-CTERM domain-containing protein